MMDKLLLVLAAATAVSADCYMQNPRGSNNRLNEDNDNTNNANRLFDSQDNNNGGYGRGPPMYFYEGSWLTVEWTAQHGCSNPKSHCDLVLQYMCGTTTGKEEVRIRDGTTTDRIPNDENFNEKTGDEFTYGMHESKEYYNMCEARSRNKGIFIADRTLNGQTAIYTRQNNNGNRRGFECPEERDYYPYWHPTPWKDIAVFASDTTRCEYYQGESQNVKAKGYCKAKKAENKQDAWKYNNEKECKKAEHEWKQEPAWGIEKPDCLAAPWSRDNHLGSAITDTLSGYMAHYNWSIPTAEQEPCIKENKCVCVLRIRYNITTDDYQGMADKPGMVDAEQNSKSKTEALVLQDPYVKYGAVQLSLALNTNQYGRTFQDRSHIFSIKKRPKELDLGQRIFNVNVRGKRGNIVQTYPSLEYDFVPNHLIIRHYDWVHFQWTGYDNNANNGNNNGEGTDGTDRSNICQVVSLNDNYCMDDSNEGREKSGVDLMIQNLKDRRRLAFLDQTDCKDLETLEAEHGENNDNDIEQDPQNCMKLNAAPPYFDGGVFRMNTSGSFHYMSTRNNNFSNRSQKGTISVMPVLGTWAIAVTVAGAVLCLGAIGVGAMMVQAKKNPMSRWAQVFERI